MEERSNHILGRSKQLSRAHQNQTAALVTDSGALDSIFLVGLEQSWRRLAILGGLFFFFGLLTVLQVPIVTDTWGWLSGDIETNADWSRPQAFRVPIVTDIDIELTFPAYMKREKETLKGTTGDIVAPQGTQVRLTGKADRLIKEAFMVMGEAKTNFVVNEGRYISGTFEVTTSGNYHFMLVTPQGDVEVDPVGHQIRLIPMTRQPSICFFLLRI